ncbi:MAG TPA: hypothetical protein VNZ54_06705 [bacterium]|jgi:hypothetical protein|nr:hypothetical protein [bacterium]HXB97726.1 hypothetical protein [bacterium]HXC62814.1 hypothetical protein [bacterium]
MSRPTQSATLSGLELHAVQSETQSETLRFRVTPSLRRHFEASVEELGIKDFSAFARGALLNAIELARLSRDPKWKAFIEAANKGLAKQYLGHGLTLNGAADLEGLGSERQGLTVKQLKERLARRKGKERKAA